MLSGAPSYSVTVVQASGRWGLLLERASGAQVPVERSYFWLAGEDGLLPTDELRAECNSGCHVLDPGRRGQREVAHELKAYAAVACHTGEMCARRLVTGEYDDHEDYRDMINHFFEHDTSKFSRFFRSAHEFKRCVLQQIPGRLEVEGRARVFRVRRIEELSPHIELAGLQPFDGVLDPPSLEPPSPRWFRKGGPLGVDFEAGCVRDNGAVVGSLREHVLTSPVTILEGAAAAGKTTTVRQLAYELLRDRAAPVYYASCHDFEDGHSPFLLASAINRLRGVVVLEDIHLQTRKIQIACSRLDHHPDRHVLLITRPSFRTSLAGESIALHDVTPLTLHPMPDAREIIRTYFDYHSDSGLRLSSRVESQLTQMGRGNLWLLAYALQGYFENGGHGEPRAWVRNGIRADLRELAARNPAFPRLLLALAPLSGLELATSLGFLSDRLGFRDEATIAELCTLGEIVCESPSPDDLYYRVPHSTLADTYWEHGTEWRPRDMSGIEEIVYDYAASGACNSLAAVLALPDDSSAELLERLASNGRLPGLIARHADLSCLGEVLGTMQAVGEQTTADCVRVIALRARELDDVRELGYCLASMFAAHDGIGNAIWNELGAEYVVAQINSASQIDAACDCVYWLQRGNTSVGDNAWNTLDQRSLADRVVGASKLSTTGRCIRRMLRASGHVAASFQRHLDIGALVNRLNSPGVVADARQCWSDILDGSHDLANRLWTAMDRNVLADKLLAANTPTSVAGFISLLLVRLPDAGRDLWSALDRDALANQVYSLPDAEAVFECLAAFPKCEAVSRDVHAQLDPRRLASVLDGSGDPVIVCMILSSFQRACSVKVARQLWRQLDQDRLARRIAESLSPGHMATSIEILREVCLSAARQVCAAIRPRELAARFDAHRDPMAVCRGVAAVWGADPSQGRQLWDTLDKGLLATRVCRWGSIGDADLCLDWLGRLDRDAARELCSNYEVSALAWKLCQDADPESASRLLRRVATVTPTKAGQIAEAIVPDSLASRLNAGFMKLSHLAYVIAAIAGAHPQRGRELCQMLDPDRVVFRTRARDDGLGLLLLTVRQTCEDSAMRLWQALGVDRIARYIDHLAYSFVFLTEIVFLLRAASPAHARELFSRLDGARLARAAEHACTREQDIELVGSLHKEHPDLGGELWQKMNHDRVAEAYSGYTSALLASCIEHLARANEDWAKCICHRLDAEQIARHMSCFDHCREASRALDRIAAIAPGKAQEICRHLGVTDLVKGLLIVDDAVASQRFIASVRKIDHKCATALEESLGAAGEG